MGALFFVLFLFQMLMYSRELFSLFYDVKNCLLYFASDESPHDYHYIDVSKIYFYF